MCDRNGNLLAPMVVESVNRHDTVLFDESFTNLLDIALDIPLTLEESYLTLDSGFDSADNRALIQQAGMISVIKPITRSSMRQDAINQRFEDFERLKDIYRERYVIERCFAWEDTYRKLVTRYEKLQSTFMGFRYLAWSMINLRSFFKSYRVEKRRNLI
jgi:transposase